MQFGASHSPVTFGQGDGLTEVARRFRELGDGDAAAAVHACDADHDWVAILTDEPSGSAWQDEHPADPLPEGVPAYIWNLASTPQDAHSTGDRYVFAGLRDEAFDVIPLIEAARTADWPF